MQDLSNIKKPTNGRRKGGRSVTTFAKRLKYAMDQAGLKQAGLAEKSSAPRSAISQYLSGRNIPGPERMRALAEATGVSLGFLTGEPPLGGNGAAPDKENQHGGSSPVPGEKQSVCPGGPPAWQPPLRERCPWYGRQVQLLHKPD